MTDGSGNVGCWADYYPFGDDTAHNCAVNAWHLFAGLFRDGEDGNDSAGNRRYASNWFRWNSPDPAGVKVVSLTDSQTWNLYMYSHDNPVTFNDPSGLLLQCPSCPQPVKHDLSRLAPGTRVDSNGTVYKAGLLHRVWNHISGRGEGQALVTSLVDSRATTTINATGQPHVAETHGNASGATITINPSFSPRVPTVAGNGEIPDQPTDPAVVLAHEMIHAYHDVTGRASVGLATHYFSINGTRYHETWWAEELRTVGFDDPTGPTENGIRRELGDDPRASYLPESWWVPGY